MLWSNANPERHSKYAHVFEPLVLPSGLELRNRIVMGSEFGKWFGALLTSSGQACTPAWRRKWARMG